MAGWALRGAPLIAYRTNDFANFSLLPTTRRNIGGLECEIVILRPPPAAKRPSLSADARGDYGADDLMRCAVFFRNL